MSYFEPSRHRAERRRLTSPSRTLDWIFDQPPLHRLLLLFGLMGYIGAAAALCGIEPGFAAATGAATSLILALLLAIYRLGVPIVSGLCFALIVGIGGFAVVLPAIVFAAMALWLLLSLPLWLFRA